MITAKFGGTAVTPSNIRYVKRIITDNHKAVVVSAVGKEYVGDVKTTDLLAEYFRSGSDEIWAKIADKYIRLADSGGATANVSRLLCSARERARKYDLAYCMSLGEEMSARIVADCLSARYVEAQDVIRFKKVLDCKETERRIKSAFKGCKTGVIGGFYGGSANGRKTFSRGGSDVTGSVVAAALDCEIYENWTDVYGVCAANPSVVNGVKTIPCMSYDEMRLLSLGGAEVLHPDAVQRVRKRAIPIKIGNFFNPDGPSTVVHNSPSSEGLLSVTEKRIGSRYKTTVLHGLGYAEAAQAVAEVCRRNCEPICIFGRTLTSYGTRIYGVKMERNKATIIADKPLVEEIYRVFTDLKVD